MEKAIPAEKHKGGHTHDGVLFSLQMDNILTHAATWASLKDTVLKLKTPVSRGQILCGFTYKKPLEWPNLQRQRAGWWVPGAAGEESGMLVFNRDRASVWEGEKVLEVGGGRGYTTT